ncbi:ribonuclease P protein component [Spirochaeta thermophila]|uniref:ribonuclease P protein component n=1 Tax=Winmispira thermophila TaxID=154 RepID=UPI0005A003F1|nr:ribonuclease P protein component [Spirochaeta thermophila]
MKRSLTKKERLARPKDIQRLFLEGRKVRVKGAGLTFIENGRDYSRILFVVPRSIKSKVERNRLKRVARECVRLQKDLLPPGYDLALILFPGDYSYEARMEQFRSLLKAAELVGEMDRIS